MFKNSFKTLISMAIPVMSGRLVHTFNTFVMMAILAQLGHTMLAASLTIAYVRIVTTVVTMAPLFALGPMVSRQFASGNTDNLPDMLRQAWLAALCLSVVPMVALSFLKPLLIACDQPANVIPYIDDFFSIFLWAMPPLLISIANMQFLAGIKKQHLITLLSLITLALNSALSYGLILGHFGLPALGATGAGIASLITTCAGCLLSSILLMTHPHLKPRKLLKGFDGLPWFRQLFKIGMPICIQIGAEMAALLCYAIITGWCGEIAMGASQISSEYMLFVIVPVFGLAEAVGITVGHAKGQQSSHSVRELGQTSWLITIAFCTIVSLVFVIFHKPLAGLFIHFGSDNAQQIYVLAMTLLAIRIVGMYFDGIADVTTGALRGLYDTRYPMWTGIITNWGISVPLAVLLSEGLGIGVVGISIGAFIGRLTSMTVILRRWKKMTADAPEETPPQVQN